MKRRLAGGTDNLSLIVPDHNGSPAQRLLAVYRDRAATYDLAIHPHGCSHPDAQLAIYGAAATPLVRGAVAYLGIGRAIIRTEGIEAILPNTFAVEVAKDSEKLSGANIQQKLADIALGVPLPQLPLEEYVYVANVTVQMADRLGLEAYYRPLTPLTAHDTEALHGVLTPGYRDVELFAFGWSIALHRPKGFCGELLARHPLPTALADSFNPAL